MKNQQILEKALLKAHKNGWTPLSTIPWKNVKVEQWQGNGMVGIALLYGEKGVDIHWVRELEGIIFNHDFAKALWSEHKCDTCDLVEWQVHLQQMVIAEDPIAYLADHI